MVMQNTVYGYTLAEVNRCILPAGARIDLSDQVCAGSFAVLVLRGELLIADAAETAAIGVRYAPGALITPVTSRRVVFTCSEETEWICLHEVLMPRETALLPVGGSGVLPAGWAAFVVSGLITTGDGATVTDNQYLRPREADTSLDGASTLILLR